MTAGLVWTVALDRKTPIFGGSKKCFRGRQVGAFSDFWPGHTGGPFIFRQKTRFFRKIDRLRGWCNITPKSWPPNAYLTDPATNWPIWWLGCINLFIIWVGVGVISIWGVRYVRVGIIN